MCAFTYGQKNVAPKNRGDFNDCLPYENSYIEPVESSKQQTGLNYFLITESTFLVKESTAFTVESTVTAIGVALAKESAVAAAAIESVFTVAVVSAELQAAKAAAITNTKRIFFIFCDFNF